MTIEDFPEYLRKRWDKIKRALLIGYYIPSPVLRVEIPKKTGGNTQQAISQVLNPIFDPEFSESSFGFRPGRSAHGAVRQVNTYVKSGYRYAVDLVRVKILEQVTMRYLSDGFFQFPYLVYIP
jgi:RNA-directed DNA polymerase